MLAANWRYMYIFDNINTIRFGAEGVGQWKLVK